MTALVLPPKTKIAVSNREPNLLIPGRKPVGSVKISEFGRQLVNDYGANIVYYGSALARNNFDAAPTTDNTDDVGSVMSGLHGNVLRNANTTDLKLAVPQAAPGSPSSNGFAYITMLAGPIYGDESLATMGVPGSRGWAVAMLGSYSGTGKSAVTMRGTYNFVANLTASSTIWTGWDAPACVGMTSYKNANTYYAKDGKTISTVASPATYIAAASSDECKKQAGGAANTYRGISAIDIFFASPIPEKLLHRITADPFSVLEPAANAPFIFPAAVSGITGTGAGTLSAITGDASGTVDIITGTGAGTLSAIIGDATGDVDLITGVGAGVLSAITGDATGDVDLITGTGAGTLSAITGDATGNVGGVTFNPGWARNSNQIIGSVI